MESIKIVIVGDGACGKSALLQAMMQAKNNYFLTYYEPTTFACYPHHFNFQGVDFRLELIDTSGQVIRHINRYTETLYLEQDILLH